MLLNGLAVADSTVWHLDNLDEIGGFDVTVQGAPGIIDTPGGKAIEFDGIDDAIFLDVHPLAGMSTFTVEVIFTPYEGGEAEQRFFHMQNGSSDERVMFETRLVQGGHWFLDTFIYSGEQKIPLYAIDNKHETGSWYHAAVVVDEDSFTHFVNGQLEMSEPMKYESQGLGRTSLGVRMNKVNWFKGAIRTVRITPRALTPEEFLTASD